MSMVSNWGIHSVVPFPARTSISCSRVLPANIQLMNGSSSARLDIPLFRKNFGSFVAFSRYFLASLAAQLDKTHQLPSHLLRSLAATGSCPHRQANYSHNVQSFVYRTIRSLGNETNSSGIFISWASWA